MRLPFACWYGVTEYCRDHAWIYYQAPLDGSPIVAAIVKVFKNGKVRLDYYGHRWTIDAGHLERLSFRN